MSSATFTRDDGREIEIDNIKWQPAERDEGIMGPWIDDYKLPAGEPPLSAKEDQRFCENATPPEPDEDYYEDELR